MLADLWRRPPPQVREVVHIRDPQIQHAVGSRAGVVVTEDRALGVSPFWKGVQLIADSIGGLPLHELIGRTVIDPTPDVLRRPYAPMNRVEVVSMWVRDLLLHGNAVALLSDFDDDGLARQLTPVHPTAVSVKVDGGRVTYRVAGNLEGLARDRVFHVRGAMLSGDVAGRSVIQVQRDGLGLAMALNEFSAGYFGDSATPSALITMGPDAAQEEAEALKVGWMARHGNRRREPAVVPSGTTFTPLSSNAEDSQLVEARQMSRLEVADMLGLDPSWLGGAPNTASMTYANIQDRRSDFVAFTLAPWIQRIEAELTRHRPDGHDVRFNLDGFLRGTTKARYEAHAIALGSGFLTVDEVRDLEDMPPLTQQEESNDDDD